MHFVNFSFLKNAFYCGCPDWKKIEIRFVINFPNVPPVTTGAGMYIVHVCFEIYLAARRSKTNPLALSQYQSSKR